MSDVGELASLVKQVRGLEAADLLQPHLPLLSGSRVLLSFSPRQRVRLQQHPLQQGLPEERLLGPAYFHLPAAHGRRRLPGLPDHHGLS